MSFLAEVFTHSSFFIAFLTAFYFLFVTYIQNESLVSDLFNIIKTNLIPISAFLDSKTIQTDLNLINSNIDKIDAYASTLDSEFAEDNALISKYVLIIVGVIAPVFLIIGIVLQYMNGESLYELLITNLIVLLFIAVSEFFIVGIFMKNFIEVDAEFLAAIVPSTTAETSSNYCKFVEQFLLQLLPIRI